MWDKPVTHRVMGDVMFTEVAYPTAGFDVPIHPLNVEMNATLKQEMYSGTNKTKWLGSPTGEIAMERMVKGWPEGIEDIRLTLGSMGIVDVPKRRTRRWGMNGEPDVARVLFFDPEPFVEIRQVAAQLVKVTVDLSTSCYYHSDTLKWRGAPAIVITEALEQAGFRVELVATQFAGNVFTGNKAPRFGATFMKMKGADEPANFPVLAGGLWTAAAFRIGMFQAEDSAPFRVDYGRGYPSEMPDEFKGDIHIPANIHTEAEARQFLEELPTLKRADLRAFLRK